MRRTAAVPLGLGLALLAFGVASTVPSDDLLQAPFPVRATVGERIASQHHVVEVHRVSLAREVTLDSWNGTTSGVWLVVEATLAARLERSSVRVEVLIDGVRYPATNRTGIDTLNGRVADAGFPLVGAVLVELPADVRDAPGARSAVLRISADGDSRLDSVLDLPVDVSALDLSDGIELDRPRPEER